MTTPTAPPPPRTRRSRARTILPPVIAVWLLLEIWLLITVADVAGGLTVFALLVAGVVLGAVVVKRAGRSAWRSLTAAAGRSSGTEAANAEADREKAGADTEKAALAMLGGLLLMIPGLVSDAVGLLCLFPPTRALLARALGRALERPRSYGPGSLGDLLSQARMHRPDGKVIQGEVVEPRGHEDSRGRQAGGTGETGGTGAVTKKNPGPQR